VARKKGEKDKKTDLLAQLLVIDPLNHFAHFERDLDNQKRFGIENVINNEFPYQSHLELGISYVNLGEVKEALDLFEMAPENPLIDLWVAYLNRDDPDMVNTYLENVLEADPEFVFPFRRETLEVLEWANSQMDNWKLKYYLALNYWGKGRVEEASKLMTECGTHPDYAPFYLARADLSKKTGSHDVLPDLAKAHDTDKSQWRTWDGLIEYHNGNKNYPEVLELTTQTYEKFPQKYDLGFKHAEALLNNGKYEECIKVMDQIQILPFEHSYGARTVFEQAHLLLALEYIDNKKYREASELVERSLEWPENIGVGKPYDPDTRPQSFLLAFCKGKLGEKSERNSHLTEVIDYTEQNQRSSPNNLIALLAMKEAKKRGDESKLISTLEAKGGDLNQWILASYYNDQDALNALKDKEENRRFLESKSMQILDQILKLVK